MSMIAGTARSMGVVVGDYHQGRQHSRAVKKIARYSGSDCGSIVPKNHYEEE